MKKNHSLLWGISILPALLVMPAMAQYTVTGTDVDLNQVEDLNLTDFGVLYQASTGPIYGILFAESDNSGTLTGESISIGGTTENTTGRAVQTRNGGALVLGDRQNTETINISTNADYGVLALGNKNKTKGSSIEIQGKTVNISAINGRAVHVGNNTFRQGATNQAHLTIDADTINISAGEDAVVAMSEGRMTINGNTTISAKNALLARGDAIININKNTENTLKMDGNIAFDYDEETSGTPVDATVDVTIHGSDSYWTGNTIATHGTGQAPNDTYMKVNSISLTMKNGATWNATEIIDNTEDDTVGSWYVAMNNLNIDNGIVNIADTNRGIIVENATIADAIFNGGMLNVGEMTLTGGTNVFNNDVIGIDDTSVLTVNSDATMNIGTNTLNINGIKLDGTMLATLRSGDDAQITTAAFDADSAGSLNLTIREAGTYHVFGDDVFANLTVDSSLYDLSWSDDEKDVTATIKSIEDIASGNNLTTEAAAAVAGLTASTSAALNDLSVQIQEKLASGSADDKQAIEQATAALNPETASVVQSTTTSVQNTVSSLAANRMSLPAVGRNGGDVRLTSSGVWAQGLYNKAKMNGQFNSYTRGVAAGIDGTINKNITIGMGYAFNHSDVSPDSRDMNIDSNTVFLYGQYKPTDWYINATLNYTLSDYEEKGTALGTPVSADYNTNAFGGQIATGYDFAGGITPELGLRYLHVNSADYTNSLGIKNEFKSADYLTAMLGTKYATNIVATKNMLLRPELRYAVKYDMISDKSSATVTMPGVAAYTLNGDRLSRIGGELGIGLMMKYKELDLSLNYDIEVREDYTSQTGMLKAKYNF